MNYSRYSGKNRPLKLVLPQFNLIRPGDLFLHEGISMSDQKLNIGFNSPADAWWEALLQKECDENPDVPLTTEEKKSLKHTTAHQLAVELIDQAKFNYYLSRPGLSEREIRERSIKRLEDGLDQFKRWMGEGRDTSIGVRVYEKSLANMKERAAK